MSHYPVFLDLKGRRCVVLGDTAIATEKVAALQTTGAEVVHQPRPFRDGDLHDAYLAIEASGDRDAQKAARREADEHHVLLNVVDVADACDWIAPAVVRRGPLQIAISTGGESPFLASTLRARLEREFDEEWAPFTQVLGTMRRRLRRRGVPADRQKRAYQRLLRSPVRALLREGRYTDAATLTASIEADGESRGGADARSISIGEVVLVGAGPGDPGLLTLGGREALSTAGVVFHDALVGERVLDLCAPGARLVNVGKRAGRESLAQEEINTMLITAARAGEFVIRLKGGDPMLFGRGGEEVAALTSAGIPVRVIPGVSAALAAPAAAGIPVTHRGVAGSVAILTGQRAGEQIERLERIAGGVDTLVVLMPLRLDALTQRLAAIVGAERPAALISAATLPGQRVVRGTVGDIAEAGAGLSSAPRTLVVGDVAAIGGSVELLGRLRPAVVLPAEEPA